MNILITENQLKYLVNYIINEQYQSKEETLKQFYKEKEMEDWFVKKILPNIEEKPDPKEPNFIDYVDKNTGKPYMIQDQKNKNLIISYNMWNFFEHNYSWIDGEIRKLLEELLDRHMNLYGLRIIYLNTFY